MTRRLSSLHPLLTSLAIILTVAIVSISPLAARATEGVSVEQAMVRAGPPSLSTTAAYLTLHNNSGKNISLTGAHSPAAQEASLHETVLSDGVTKMRPVPRVQVAAGASVTLSPGGLHLMLNGLRQPLHPGESVEIVLEFSDGSTLPVHAEVRDLRDGGHDHEHAHEHKHEDMH